MEEKKAKNKKTNSIAELVDLYPTLCDLTKGEKPSHLQGNSLTNSLLKHDKIYNNDILIIFLLVLYLIYLFLFYK